jgi:hypothetical protein
LSCLTLALAFAGADGRAQCALGAWEAPFNHAANAGSGICDPTNTRFRWENNATAMAVHMSVIPKGPRQGWILMWPHDDYAGSISLQRYHRWSLVNPVPPITSASFLNFCVPLPGPVNQQSGKGDLFCAGHAWTANGDLLVVGGTGERVGSSWGGSVLAYLWRPPQSDMPTDGGTWAPVPDLDEPRWYPSVVALGPDPDTGQDRMLVGGGTHSGNTVDSYQVWTPSGGPNGSWQTNNPSSPTPNTFPGPLRGVDYELHNYPRLILMSGGGPNDLARVMNAGMVVGSDRVSHYASPGTWLPNNPPWLQAHVRDYGTSVLLPISPGGILKDWAISIGGRWWQAPNTYHIATTVQVTNGGGSGAGTWVGGAGALTYKRWLCNSVLTPDSRLIVFGGEQQEALDIVCSEVPAFVPERYDLQTNQWMLLAADAIIRNYHSTAVVLPSGKVLTAGGDWRHWLAETDCAMKQRTPNPIGAVDYRVFVPGYIQCGATRPVITNAAPAGGAIICTQGGTCEITYQNLPFPLTIDKVVLLRPGSVTHHADTNQRCVELNFSVDLPVPGGPDALVTATIPTKNSGLLPRGYYLLFLVTNERVPSAGVWVKVQ